MLLDPIRIVMRGIKGTTLIQKKKQLLKVEGDMKLILPFIGINISECVRFSFGYNGNSFICRGVTYWVFVTLGFGLISGRYERTSVAKLWDHYFCFLALQ